MEFYRASVFLLLTLGFLSGGDPLLHRSFIYNFYADTTLIIFIQQTLSIQTAKIKLDMPFSISRLQVHLYHLISHLLLVLLPILVYA